MILGRRKKTEQFLRDEERIGDKPGGERRDQREGLEKEERSNN